jgi:hypothetical protein
VNLISFYRIPIDRNSLSPNIGVGYENVAANESQKKSVEFTGSTVTTAIFGLEYNFKKIGIGINGQVPMSQNFAEGQTRMKFKGMLHMTFVI